MILFVCSGNTCRSPMAEGLAKQKGADAASAGLFPDTGAPASMEAQAEMARRGIDISSHRAKPVTESLLQSADTVYCMTPMIVSHLCARFPAYCDKIRLMRCLVPDPYGGTAEDYKRAANEILRTIDTL